MENVEECGKGHAILGGECRGIYYRACSAWLIMYKNIRDGMQHHVKNVEECGRGHSLLNGKRKECVRRHAVPCGECREM